MKKIIFLWTFLSYIPFCQAQDVPFYLHFFNNFYPQNPAFAGNTGYPVAYLTYHRQVIGTVSDAPRHAALTFDSPIKRERNAWGATVYSFNRSILVSTGGYLTYAQQVRLGVDHFARLGISLGANYFGVNTSDLSTDDITTLQVINRYNKTVSPDGQLGLLYQIGYLQIGATLPKLFRSAAAQGNDQARELYPLRNQMYSLSYQFYINPDWLFHPYIIYRNFEYETGGAEVNGTLTYHDQVWAGASYRQDYGAAFMVGLRKNLLSVGFGYKLSNQQQNLAPTPAYEIQVGLHLGKRRLPPVVAAAPPAPVRRQAPVTKSEVPVIKGDTALEKIIRSIQTVRQGYSNNPLEMEANYFLVVGSFRSKQNAQSYTYQLRRDERNAQLGYNTTNQMHYVFLYQTDERDMVAKIILELRKQSGFENAWLLRIIKEE
jgi:type IX secretion system PorP/SprF family membrane protein